MVDILPSKAGKGLKVKNFEIGCARIIGVDVPEGEEVETLFNGPNGLLSYGFIETEEGIITTNDLSSRIANNYVLVKIEDNAVSTINSAKEICEIFELSDNDADTLDQYITALATDRQLVLNRDEDLAGNPLMYFTNTVDNEISEVWASGDVSKAREMYDSINASPDFRAEYKNNSFIKMFLMALISACQDRYNKVNRDERITRAAAVLGSIRYWNDGQLYKPTVRDIENYLDSVKDSILVE
jgi:hypothetical protein